MKIYTIGFTKKTAQSFFTRLQDAGVKRLVDVRLNNVSQLAGFAKRDDLRYFTNEICKIDYVHLDALAPTKGMLDEYKKMKGSWHVYEERFLDLMKARKIEQTIDPTLIGESCLLCSEEKPHHCHRRLVAEYLQKHWAAASVEIVHIP